MHCATDIGMMRQLSSFCNGTRHALRQHLSRYIMAIGVYFLSVQILRFW